MKQIIFGLLALLLVLSVVSISEAKTYKVTVRAHIEKICPGDKLYFRMTDNTKNAETGEHQGLIWKTKYFEATKTDYKWKVKVDPKKVPTGILRTYDEVERNGHEIWDEYKRDKLGVKSVNFLIPALC